jgi:3-methyladenine DNA glycosylase AlkD
LIFELEKQFKIHSNTENGLAMSKYMKDRFPFYGIKSELRKEIQKQWIANLPKDLKSDERWGLIRELWEKEQREFHYVAIDWLNSWNKKFIEEGDSEQLHFLITNRSWWDSVDSIASNYLGKYCQKFPVLSKNLIEKWRYDDNMWLNRSCLIFQLKYGNAVDFDLLKALITQYQPVKEFFIQKAIGWSLRQYSKFNPDAVRVFIDDIKLQGLAKKEGSKYI